MSSFIADGEWTAKQRASSSAAARGEQPPNARQTEQIRRDWLAEALTAHGMCAAGYVLETRQFDQPWEGPFGNGGDIVYTGRCL